MPEMPETAHAEREIVLGADCPYFAGHFPGFPVLPAVAQVAIVIRLADECFGCGCVAAQIKRIKFSAFITPERRLRVALDYKAAERCFAFKIPDACDGRLFSAGAIVCGSPAP
jgi:3-hydroxymyristoyl/3-hydroxydecanoyl-(acyl carrier protein) dehydratase